MPARYASSRLPGKPLADIMGKPMVVRVADRCRESCAEEVVVAVDHKEVFEAVKDYGHTAVMTSVDHTSGTDRVLEVTALKSWGEEDLVVNVQGDEPSIPTANIDQIIELLNENSKNQIVTLCEPIADKDEFLNPDVVKVVTSRNGYALYFSRAPIPYPRDSLSSESLTHDFASRHIGIYGFRVSTLKQFVALTPGDYEIEEKLEQLRWLQNGGEILVLRALSPSPGGVDTPEELERVRAIWPGN